MVGTEKASIAKIFRQYFCFSMTKLQVFTINELSHKTDKTKPPTASNGELGCKHVIMSNQILRL